MSDNSQENTLLTEEDQKSFMEGIGEAVTQTIKTGDSVLISFPKFDLMLMVVQDDFSIQSSLYLLSKCTKNEDGEMKLPMPPLYVGRRHIMNHEDFEGFFNEEVVKQQSGQTSQAMYFIMNLLRTIRLGPGTY